MVHAIYTIIFLTPEKHHKKKINFRERLQSNKKRPVPVNETQSMGADEVFKAKNKAEISLRADSGYSNSEERPPGYFYK